MQAIFLLRIQMPKSRSYSELKRLDTFEDRYKYLRIGGLPGLQSFGFDRWINQRFYRSREWKNVRDKVILRDNGCDLGVEGFEIHSGLMIHHMNPVSVDDIEHGEAWIVDPEFLITTSLQTHNAIHYGDETLLPRGPIERTRGDTTLW